MRLSNDGIHHVVRCLILDGENHRQAIFEEINRAFVKQAITFFSTVAEAKLRGEDVGAGSEWYQRELVQSGAVKKDDAAIHAGLPMKTINNIYETTRREVVINTGIRNYETLQRTINEFVAVCDGPSDHHHDQNRRRRRGFKPERKPDSD